MDQSGRSIFREVTSLLDSPAVQELHRPRDVHLALSPGPSCDQGAQTTAPLLDGLSPEEMRPYLCPEVSPQGQLKLVNLR